MKRIAALLVIPLTFLVASCASGVGDIELGDGQHSSAQEYTWHVYYNQGKVQAFDYYTNNEPVFVQGRDPQVVLANAREANGVVLTNNIYNTLTINVDPTHSVEINKQPASADASDPNDFEWRVTWIHEDGTKTVFYTHHQPRSIWANTSFSDSVLEMTSVSIYSFNANLQRYSTYYLVAPDDLITIESRPKSGWRN